MKPFLYAALRFIVASLFAWGGILIWAFTMLEQDDSYRDRTPMAADTFVALWLIGSIVAAFGAVKLSRRPTR